MSQRFKIVEVNPNQTTGGGGCLCSEVENADCKGPFAVFYHQEMANNASPHPVLCLDCARAALEAAEHEVLAGGEPVPEATAAPLDPEPVKGVTHKVTADGDVEPILEAEAEELPEI